MEVKRHNDFVSVLPYKVPDSLSFWLTEGGRSSIILCTYVAARPIVVKGPLEPIITVQIDSDVLILIIPTGRLPILGPIISVLPYVLQEPSILIKALRDVFDAIHVDDRYEV